MNNKYYSDRQEKMIAKYLGWNQVRGSGSKPSSPGDVREYTFLGECKTHDTEKTNISFLKSHWVKICEEASAKHKFPVLFKDNGTQLASDTWVMTPLSLFNPSIVNIIDGLKNTSKKDASFSFNLSNAKELYRNDSVDGKYNVFKHTWNDRDLAIMPLSTFRCFVEEQF